MSDTLKSLSDAMADLVSASEASVVRIEGRRRMPATGVVWDASGRIITANHVLERDDEITVGFTGGGTATASVVGRDPSTDVALIRVDRGDLSPATWAETSSLRVGNLVLAMGRPGRTLQATLGIVSAIGGTWRTHGGGEIDAYLQTDVAMYPGFSGGPLVTASGQFAGINSSALMRGISVTIPAATLRKVAAALAAHGKMPRGYLGVGIQPVRLPAAFQEQLGQETGLMVMSVEPGTPAAEGGIFQGDILVRLADSPVRSIDDLQSLLSADRVGSTVPAKVIRGGAQHDLTVTIGQQK